MCSATRRLLTALDWMNNLEFSTIQDYKKVKTQYSCDSILIQKNDVLLTKSRAVEKMICNIPFFWPTLPLFWIFPRKLKDNIYDKIAKNRMKWFGRANCALPIETRNNKTTNNNDVSSSSKSHPFMKILNKV